MDIWKELEKYYATKGISAAQFFNDGNSTEVARDEMLLDFAYRMLQQQETFKKHKETIRQLSVAVKWTSNILAEEEKQLLLDKASELYKELE